VQVTLDQYMAHEKLWYVGIQMGQINSKIGWSIYGLSLMLPIQVYIWCRCIIYYMCIMHKLKKAMDI
jgi:hypothetical protein